jgi:hypothetical protein
MRIGVATLLCSTFGPIGLDKFYTGRPTYGMYFLIATLLSLALLGHATAYKHEGTRSLGILIWIIVTFVLIVQIVALFLSIFHQGSQGTLYNLYPKPRENGFERDFNKVDNSDRALAWISAIFVLFLAASPYLPYKITKFPKSVTNEVKKLKMTT